MADQAVRVTNLPQVPDSGSVARVALDMTKYLINYAPKSENNEERVNAILDLYADCYHAASGYRTAKRKGD